VTPVITSRLWERLTPLERLLYTSDDLVTRLIGQAIWRTGGASVDGWEPEDFVAYALAESARYDWVTPSAAVTWMNRKIDARIRAAGQIRYVPLDERPDQEAEPFVPTRLPESVVAWLNEHLDPWTAHAVQIHSEEGLTVSASAAKVGIDRQTLVRALAKLRKVME
jgi:predicted DNA-binding protein (UPF0251 family)